METATRTYSDCYSFLKDSSGQEDSLTAMAVDDLGQALDRAAIGFLDTNIVLRATLAGFLDSTPPEEVEPEVLARAGKFSAALAERVLMHPRIRMAEGIARELEPVRDRAEEIIARDIAAYSVSYASLEARRLVPFLREYRGSLDALSAGLAQFREAQHIPLHRGLYSSILKLVQLLDDVSGLGEGKIADQNLVTAAIYELLERAMQQSDCLTEIVVLSSDRDLQELMSASVRLVRDAEFVGQPHRLANLFDQPRANGGAPRGGRITVVGYHEQARRFRPAYSSSIPSPESLNDLLTRLLGAGNRDQTVRLLREAAQSIAAEHERAFRESVIAPPPEVPAEPTAPITIPEPKLEEPQPEETRPIMETITTPKETPPAAELAPAAPAPSEAKAEPAPTLDSLPPTEDLTAQILRKLYRRSYASLSQVATDVERLGDKLLIDEGTRRLAERCGDEALAKVLADEVGHTKQVVEGKLAILQTQKAELLQKKAALNAEIEGLRGSVVVVANAVEREMDLLRRDAELGRGLSEVLAKLRAFSPLADSLSRIGSGSSAIPSAEGTFRLAQLIEELGEESHNVSALIKQLREKGILPPKQQRGIYTSQERQIILDLYRSKSVSAIAREWGNAVTTLKQVIIERLIEGRDYYNLGKGGERDSFRVTLLGLEKLKKALSLTRARGSGN